MSTRYKYCLERLDSVPSLAALQRQYPHYRGFLFDMDGTLIDSEIIHAEATLIMMGPRVKKIDPKEFPALKEELIGKADPEVMLILQNRGFLDDQVSISELVLKKNDILLDELKKKLKGPKGLEQYLYKEVVTLLEQIKMADIPMALVTASETDLAFELLDIFDLEHFFDSIVTRDSAEKTKPFATPYLLAQERLNLQSCELLIFEDSHTGMQAAEEAQISFIHANWYPGLERLPGP